VSNMHIPLTTCYSMQQALQLPEFAVVVSKCKSVDSDLLAFCRSSGRRQAYLGVVSSQLIAW
jgi:hypothetical protein